MACSLVECNNFLASPYLLLLLGEFVLQIKLYQMFAVFGGIHDLRLKFPKPYSVSKAFSHSNGFRIDFMLLYVHADARAT